MRAVATSRGLHWAIGAAFLLVGATAIMNQTFYSKEAIMRSFEFSLPMVGVDMPPADQLFVARIARRAGWVFHFWAGIALVALFFIKTSVDARIRKVGRWHLLFGVLVAVMAATGLPLHFRSQVHIEAEVVDAARFVHHWSAWAVAAVFAGHLVGAIRKEIAVTKTSAVAIAVFFLSLGPVLPDLHAATYHRVKSAAGCAREERICRKGVAYLEGRIGAKRIERIMPDCPYERCGKPKKGSHIDLPEGGRKYVITKPDFRKAVSLLLESAKEEESVAAAREALSFLLGRIDYKSSCPSEVLVTRLKKEVGMDLDAYRRAVGQLVGVLVQKCDPYGIRMAKEFARHGHLGLKMPDVSGCPSRTNQTEGERR